MSRYCAARGLGFVCCEARSTCSSVHLQRDIPVCATSCEADCMDGYHRVDCVFDRDPVGIATLVVDGAVNGSMSIVPVCAGVTR